MSKLIHNKRVRLLCLLAISALIIFSGLSAGCQESNQPTEPEPITPPVTEPVSEPEQPAVTVPEQPAAPEPEQPSSSTSGSLFNQAPKITSATIDKDLVTTSGTCQLACEARDQDRRDELTFTWTATGGTIENTSDSTSSNATWTAPNEVGTYNITIIVSDGRGGEATNTFIVSVFSENNYPPFINKLTAEPREPWDDEFSILTCEATDMEGDEITYNWEITGGIIEGEGPVVTWYPPDVPGDKEEHTLTVTLTDSAGNTSGRKWLHITAVCACIRPEGEATPSEEGSSE